MKRALRLFRAVPPAYRFWWAVFFLASCAIAAWLAALVAGTRLGALGGFIIGGLSSGWFLFYTTANGRRARRQRALLRARCHRVGSGEFLPDRDRFIRDDRYVWADPDSIKELSLPLLAEGFSIVGVYGAQGNANYHVMFLFKESESAVAALSQTERGIALHIYSYYPDGGVVLAINSAVERIEIPGERLIRKVGALSKELYQLFLGARIGDKKLAITADSIPARCEEYSARHYAWWREQARQNEARLT